MKNLANKNLYYVGGVVRDEFIGANSFDTDFCYEGNAIDFAKSMNLNIIKENPDFGTVRITYNDKVFDIASTRKESYPKAGHLPKVTDIGCALKEDLKRRDFTINAIAKRTTDNEIIDHFNGMSDLKKGLIRVLHKKSFIDDPTRIIRGLKFSVRFGFNLEKETKKLQNEYLDNINYDMSYHRLKKELVETFNLNIGKAFDIFIEQGIYKLLGERQQIPYVRGNNIQNTILKTDYKISPWIIYMAFFDLSKLPLTRIEKRIINEAKNINIKGITNNTPVESIIINNIMKETA